MVVLVGSSNSEKPLKLRGGFGDDMGGSCACRVTKGGVVPKQQERDTSRVSV